MKRLAEDSQRFRVEDVPPRLHEKERVAAAFRDIGKSNFKLKISPEDSMHTREIEFIFFYPKISPNKEVLSNF